MGAAVEAATEDDGIRPPGDLLGELDRGLSDLGAGVGEEEGVDCSGRQFGQLGRQRLEQVVLVDVDLGVNEPLGLSGDGRGHLGVGVTGRVDGNAGGKVEILLAVGRGDPTAMSTGHLKRRDGEPHVGEMRRLFHARNATPLRSRGREGLRENIALARLGAFRLALTNVFSFRKKLSCGIGGR